ncbi:MAG: molybdenum cofactor guanylyltransferase [Bacteroidetes bacterium]|nr:molybdenum cofactor guanylyltransferase [Bacteroidota bacterium]
MTGVVLAGGKSSRMGTDKGLMNFEGKPMWLRMHDLIVPYCEQVIISCKEAQVPLYPDQNVVIDLPDYESCGPLSGLLSVFRTYPDEAILAVGCDYPLLTATEIVQLVDGRRQGYDAVCFHDAASGWDEPLPAVYEKTTFSLMIREFQDGHYSPRQILRVARTVRLKAIHPERLSSVNTPSEFLQALNRQH